MRMTTLTTVDAAASGTFAIGGDLKVNRLGFGAMRIVGECVWGVPNDAEYSKGVLRRAVELGVNFIDTSDAYGPDVSELLIGEALAPYKDGVVIATKAGLVRTGPGKWEPLGRPAYLRQEVEMSLRHLKLDRPTCGSYTASIRRCRWRSRSARLRSCSRKARFAMWG